MGESERSALDPVWDAVAEIADEGSVKGLVDYSGKRGPPGVGLLRFSIGGVRLSVDIYAPERPTTEDDDEADGHE